MNIIFIGQRRCFHQFPVSYNIIIIMTFSYVGNRCAPDGRRRDRARENEWREILPVAFFSGRINTARDVPIHTLML